MGPKGSFILCERTIANGSVVRFPLGVSRRNQLRALWNALRALGEVPSARRVKALRWADERDP